MQPQSPELFLTETLAKQKEPIAKYQFNEQTVWVKKAGKRHSTWLYGILRVCTQFLGVKALTPVPNLGGSQAILTEAKRLLSLQQHHIHVPALLAHNQHGLMIADMGNAKHPSIQLEAALKDCKNQTQCLEVFKTVVDAIHDVHQHRAWLSEAFLRNILLDVQGNISFIDFESEPRQYLSEPLCYARDWLCLMFSSAIYLQQHDAITQGAQYLYHKLQQEPEQTLNGVDIVCRRLKWIGKLPVGKLGKDGLRMMAVANLLKQLHLQIKPLPLL